MNSVRKESVAGSRLPVSLVKWLSSSVFKKCGCAFPVMLLPLSREEVVGRAS